jgi:putative colanic acid biosynthesis acetyltransferase WcaF
MAVPPDDIPVVDLSQAPGEKGAWDRPKWLVYAWALCELLCVTNPLQISSSVRVRVLRLFGAQIGRGVIMRPRVRVKFPWKLSIGARSWIGEGVWIHNQDRLYIGSDVVVSQDTFITTGTHAFRADMALVTKPVVIADGAWVTSRCVVLAGTRIGRSSVILPGTVVRGEVPAATIYGSPPGQVVGKRFRSQGAQDEN